MHYAYFVRARPDRGQSYLDSLSKECENILGKDRSQELMSGMISFDYLGGIGKHDLDLEFISNSNGMVVKYGYLNPSNGALTREGESTFDDFKEKFGDVFDFPEEN